MSERRNITAEVAAWPEGAQKYFAECLKFEESQHPNAGAEYQRLAAYRLARQVCLEDGLLQLEHIPGWGMQGRARSAEELARIPKDDGYERLQRRLREVGEERQRRAAENAEPELDEPRRQYAGGR